MSIDFNAAKQQALNDINGIFERTKTAMDRHEKADTKSLQEDLTNQLKALMDDPEFPDSVKRDFQNLIGKMANQPDTVDISSLFMVAYELQGGRPDIEPGPTPGPLPPFNPDSIKPLPPIKPEDTNL